MTVTIKTMRHAKEILATVNDQDDPRFEAAQIYVFENSTSVRSIESARDWLKAGTKAMYRQIIEKMEPLAAEAA